MRIAFLADPGTNNGFYRGIGPMSALAARGHQVRPLSVDHQRPPLADVRDVDILHVHRYFDERAESLIREAKRHGAAVVWDDDDDAGSIPKGTPAYRKYGGLMWERRLAAMKRIFRDADLVTTPSAVLAGRLRGYGAGSVQVVENYIPGLFLQRERPTHAGFTIGWVAGKEHQIDVERLPILQALQRVLEAHEHVTVMSIGLSLGLRSERYRHLGTVPLLERTSQTFERRRAPVAVLNRPGSAVKLDKAAAGGLANHTATFDLGIAPLADVPLNQSRSNVKLKEYAAGGAAWLASPVGPYAGLGERQGGRLVADGAWEAELQRLIAKPRERQKLAKRAAKWAEGETIERNAERWERAFQDALQRSRAAA